MPFFSGKFSPKKTTPRRPIKSESDVSGIVSATSASLFEADSSDTKRTSDIRDFEDEITITLGDQIIRFDNGAWIPENGPVGGSYKENVKLKKRVHELEEENNLLKIKYDVMLDMLTKTTADFHLQTKEIEELRVLRKTSKSLEFRDC